MNRLTAANFLQNPSGSTWNNYDANGNILGMNQFGFKVGTLTGLIDELAYHYQTNSNKLSFVIDQILFIARPSTVCRCLVRLGGDKFESFIIFLDKKKNEMYGTKLMDSPYWNLEPMGKAGWNKNTRDFYLFSKDNSHKWMVTLNKNGHEDK